MELLLVQATDLLIKVDLYYMLILVPMILAMILVMFIIWVVSNGEAVFWLMRRHSGKVAVLEFDDSGRVLFKAEKPLGQGVFQGEDPREYNFQPRSLGGDMEKAVKSVADERYQLYISGMQTAMDAKGDGKAYEPPEDLYKQIESQIREDLKAGRTALETATTLNNYRSYTWGLKTPLYLRYSGKAINVNPVVAMVASQDPDAEVIVQSRKGPLMARVQDLKNFFSVMVTPSQVRAVTTRSELIGARQLGSKMSFTPIIILLVLMGVMLFVIMYILPMLGIKVF